jgi:hypothetical protein
MRKAIFLAISLIGVLMLIAGTADAQSAKRHRTRIILTQGGATGASGTVGCTSTPCPMVCLSKRHVTLWRIQNGVSTAVGTTVTNPRGGFKVSTPLITGYYKASVIIKHSRTTSCTAATSIRYHF